MRLCEAEHALIHRFDGQLLRVVAARNVTPSSGMFLSGIPSRPARAAMRGAPPSSGARSTFTMSWPTPSTPSGRTRVDPTPALLADPDDPGGELLGSS